MRFASLLILLILLTGCRSRLDYLNSELKSKNGHYQAVIEIPAGTNTKIEYNKLSKRFDISKRDGKERHIGFLAYPANYGFLPSTFSDPEKGGDGDALDVMVISSSLDSGTIIEILPVGVLKLLDAGEEDFKVIGIPIDPELRNIDVKNFREFSENFEGAKSIIETWFLNYDPSDTSEILGWGDEQEARDYIEASTAKF